MAGTNTFITMQDGVRLAVSLYLPRTSGPWPVLLEAYPYRKDDLAVWEDDYLRLRDEGDYAVCRLDVRGTGTSEGAAVAEYPPQEADDLCEVIAWLAAQEWSTGAVGMYGTSYAGFNTIHAAMAQPPALKAIVPIFATDDRYTDDIHFVGGVRKAIEFGYPLFMVPRNALPPTPSLAGPNWREQWLERIDRLEPWFGQIEEQNDGPFWRQGSLRPNYDRIRVPTMLVAGWSDVYRNAMVRMYEHLEVPKRLLLGPWAHMTTSDSIPGPHIDLVPELIRWYDRWLRDIPNGIDEEPPIAVFVRHSTPPEPDLPAFRGVWRSEPVWPPMRARELVLPLGEGVLAAGQRDGSDGPTLRVRGDVGVTAHIQGSYDPPYGLPIDQRPDHAYSLLYDWPVTADTEILGTPRLHVSLRSSVPVAFLSAKLCEVLEDGTTVLVSRGLVNLSHRDSHSSPEALVPGESYDVTLDLDATSWVFATGGRVRLAIAGADWPNAWPPPEASELTIEPADSRLVLPHIVGDSPTGGPPALTVLSNDGESERIAAATEGAVWRIEHDVYARETRVVVHQESTSSADDGSWSGHGIDEVTVGVHPAEPGKAFVESICEDEVSWPEVKARARARLLLTSDTSTYDFALVLEVWENDELVATRNWHTVTPRKLQ